MVNARMSEDLYGQIELNPPHWVLQERQLVNWGSYGGYHTFNPSTMFDGTVTLLTGQSESGKSTLVDAQVSLLYPTGAAFNKASNAGRSDRSDYSYLRGQRGIRNDNGHDEPVFLRGMTDDGEPYAVWGAIVDRYEDTTGGGTLSIAKFMTLPAGGRSEDVDKFFLVSRDPIDPRLMDDYRDDVFSVPLFKRVYRTATVYRQANLFHEDVWNRFGLTESACRLLHRMQASDAPSQLDDIFRKGVLDEPSALHRGRALIGDYTQFSENFTAIEHNLRRVDLLERMADKHIRYMDERKRMETLRAVDPERAGSAEARKAWLGARVHECIARVAPTYEQGVAENQTKVASAQRETDRLDAELETIREQKNGHGGDRLQRLQEQLRDAERERERMSARIERLVPQFTKAGRTVPRTANAWQALAEEAVGVRDAYDERRKEFDALGYPLQERYSAMRREVEELQADIERKRRSRTRITKEMAEARTMMARAAGLEPEQLPYVAELMDVQGGEEQWRTAMNVVYASLAPVILVDKQYERGFARAISRIPHASMARRNWQFVDVQQDYHGEPREGWMSGKLTFNEESPFAGWVRARVADARSDARCVTHIDDSDVRTRQVQEDGQIKDGAHGSHGTKNISQVIGFVTEAYLRELADELERLERTMDRANGEIERISARKAELEAQRDLAQAVLAVDWNDIDVQTADTNIAMLHGEIERILADPALAELDKRERECKDALAGARKRLARAEDELAGAKHASRAARAWLEAHGDERPPALNEACTALLEQAFDGYFGTGTAGEERAARMLGLDAGSRAPGHGAAAGTAVNATLHALGKHAEKAARAWLEELRGVCEARKSECETAMAAYIEQFMANDDRVSADVENFQVFEHDLRELNASTIRASADEEYFHSLEKIHQDLMQLNTALDADRSKILEQIGKINRLLERYPFGARRGRLSIEPQVSKSDPQFLAALRARLADLNAYQQQGRKDIEQCKQLFAACAPFVELVKASFDEFAANKRGNANLDPRRRSRFFGEVTDPDGTVERINSTGGGSGGYLQELTSFAYGAALMYLLANDNATEPSYATVFLDEALIKADGQYTRRALSVLPGLGFQVIVSAPEAKTGEIMASASKVVVARKDPENGLTELRAAVLGAGDDDAS